MTVGEIRAIIIYASFALVFAGGCSSIEGLDTDTETPGQTPTTPPFQPTELLAIDAQGARIAVSRTQPPEVGSTGTVAPEVAYTIPPGVPSHVAVPTAPGAICVVRREDGSAIEGDLRLMADEEGLLNLYPQPTSPGSQKIRFECRSDDNRVSIFPVALNVASGATAPAAREHARATPTTGFLRPALSGDPLQYTQQELHSLGYPRRPDADSSAYAAWLSVVSQPTTVITPRLVEIPRQKNDFTSLNWSGSVSQFPNTFPPTSAFDAVAGTATVPTVRGGDFTGEFGNYSSLWVGLGGTRSQALMQCGTEQDVI